MPCINGFNVHFTSLLQSGVLAVGYKHRVGCNRSIHQWLLAHDRIIFVKFSIEKLSMYIHSFRWPLGTVSTDPNKAWR